MAFNAEQKFIYDLFGRKTYGIPRNQRRYVWQERNWEELFEDITYSITSGTSHFLGSFVLKDEGRQNGLPNFTIIDGQQRIITLTIFLGSILYWLKKKKMKDDFKGSRLYVFTEDDKAIETTILKSEYHLSLESIINSIRDMDQDKFDKISINKFLENACLNSKKDKNIVAAFKYFITKIEETLLLNKDDNYLIKLRDAVVNISYISIISTSEEDSYTIFEILNARGTELEDHELLKNYIMRYIQPEINRDKAKSIWTDMEVRLGNDFNKFIKHYCTHKCKYKVNGVSAYKTIQMNFKGRNTEDLLNDLQKKSFYYSKLVNPQENCTIGTVEYRVLSFFRKKRQEQLRPVLLGIIHHHEIGDIDDKLYDETLSFVFNFYLCYSIIGEESSNKLTNVIYKYAESIENRYSDNLLTEFSNNLKEKLPNKTIFQNAFKNIGYSKLNSFYEGEKNKDKVQTVLEVLERYLNDGICLENFTIEHVLDDSNDEKNGQIGNLIPLEQRINNNLNRKNYDQKIDKYSESNYRTTRNFAKKFKDKNSFDPENRTKYLADLFYDNILVLKR